MPKFALAACARATQAPPGQSRRFRRRVQGERQAGEGAISRPTFATFDRTHSCNLSSSCP
eukprot:6196476-Pleurochrysis_carterae.AAC.1